jgi:hypothetical protein
MRPEGSRRVDKSPPLGPKLSQLNPIYIHTPHFLKIHFNIIQPSTPVFHMLSLPSGIPNKILYPFIISLLACYMSCHLIVLDLITVIIFGEQYKLLSS